MNVLITGDSHLCAIRRGHKQLQDKDILPTDVQFTIQYLGGGHLLRTPFFKDKGSYAEITEPSYRKNFTRFPVDDNPDWYGFCAPLHTAKIYRSSDWEHYSTLDMPQRERLISKNLFRRIVLDDQEYVLTLFEIMKRSHCKIFAIEAPHPFRHHPAVETNGEAMVRYIDLEYRRIMRERLALLGVPVICAPPECIGEDDFTRDEYRSDVSTEDTHHANSAYGAIMLGKILAFLKDADLEGKKIKPGHTKKKAAEKL